MAREEVLVIQPQVAAKVGLEMARHHLTGHRLGDLPSAPQLVVLQPAIHQRRPP